MMVMSINCDACKQGKNAIQLRFLLGRRNFPYIRFVDNMLATAKTNLFTPSLTCACLATFTSSSDLDPLYAIARESIRHDFDF